MEGEGVWRWEGLRKRKKKVQLTKREKTRIPKKLREALGTWEQWFKAQRAIGPICQ